MLTSIGHTALWVGLVSGAIFSTEVHRSVDVFAALVYIAIIQLPTLLYLNENHMMISLSSGSVFPDVCSSAVTCMRCVESIVRWPPLNPCPALFCGPEIVELGECCSGAPRFRGRYRLMQESDALTNILPLFSIPHIPRKCKHTHGI